MNRYILPALLVVALALPALAQTTERPYVYESVSEYDRYVTFNFSARYGVAIPMGGLKSYVGQTSATNLAIDGEWLFPQRFSIGLKSGYQYTSERLPRQTIDYDDQTISAVQTRTFSVIPIMASLSYYFAQNSGAIRPYVQIAGGGAVVDYINYFGALADQSKGFKGAIAPAVGLKFYGRPENKFGAEIQAQYQNVFFNYGQLPGNAPTLMLSAGLIYRWY
jgi:hypothetical protein